MDFLSPTNSTQTTLQPPPNPLLGAVDSVVCRRLAVSIPTTKNRAENYFELFHFTNWYPLVADIRGNPITRRVITLRSARNAYASAAVETVAPEKLLIMLFDALVRNLVQAEKALEEQATQVAHDKLIVAQDIIGELISSLDPNGFDGGQQLLGLYTFIYGELLDANLAKSKAKVMGVRSLVEPLAETWREVAAKVAETTTPANAQTLESISVAG